jgi:N6-adenosine-specific RNA methylase IME4
MPDALDLPASLDRRPAPAKRKTARVVGFELPGQATRTGWQLPEALTFEEWDACGRGLDHVDGALMWWRGDWLRFGERKYGETYAQAIETTGDNYQTLRNAQWVAGAFELSRRRDILSWSHHAEVAGIEDAATQDRFLDEAESENLSKRQLRQRVTDWKRGTNREKQEFDAAALGKFNVIYADPPWSYSNSGLNASAQEHYPTMPTDEICAMRVADSAMDDAVLFLWATNPLLPDALRVLDAWGFEYKTNFVWLKDAALYGKLGFYNLSRHELLLIATRGSFLPQGELPLSLIEAPKGEHSRKPATVYEIIETMYPRARRLELFCRGPARDGWSVFGNQVMECPTH